jgi:GH35 family endo-1,4-beta-xylanase
MKLRYRSALTLPVLSLLLLPLAAAAERVDVAGQSGRLMPFAEASFLGGPAADDATLERIRTEHGPGVRVTTQRQPRFHYSIELRQPLAEPIADGDVVYAEFWARAVAGARYETGEGFTLFRIQRNAPPWERGLYRELSLEPQWKRYTVGERMNADLPAGQGAVFFSAGYPPQTIEIAGLRVINLGPDADPEALPQMTSDYLGSEPDAAWRKQAWQRIEQHRKADAQLRLVDEQGRPVADTEVEIQLESHAFDFGVAVSAVWFDQHWDSADAERARQTLVKHFNSIAIENALKWSWWERDPQVALRTLRWANEAGLRVHGHVLVWPGIVKFRTEDADELWAAAQDDPSLLERRVEGHIHSILDGTRGMVQTWDVVNEAYNQRDFIELLGNPIVTRWFELARQGAPDATLLYNDFGLLGQSGNNRRKHDFIYDLVEQALSEGAPIDAIGFQSHMGSGMTPPQRLLDILDRFAELGLGLQITEYDLTVTDEDLAERYTRDFLVAVFSHPDVTAFQAWNFWSGAPTWAPDAALFGDDWQPKPVGRALLSLLENEWDTHVQQTSDAEGGLGFRGFKGRYLVTLPDGRRGELHLSEDTATPREVVVR